MEGKFCLREELRGAKDLVHKPVVFPKVIKKRAMFVDINRRGTSVRTKGIVAVCLKIDGQDAFVGYTASRRVGSAVKRNFAKRRMRELVREFAEEFLPGCAFVFIANVNTTVMKFADLKSDFVYSLRKSRNCEIWHDRKDFCSNDKAL